MINRPIRTNLSSTTLSLVGIPKKFHNKTLDDFMTFGNDHLLQVRNFIESYLDSFEENIDQNQGLFLSGTNGVGKTFIASILAKEAYRRRLSVRRSTFVEYIDHYTRSWGTKNLEDREVEEDEFNVNYRTVEFLVLEEIGKEVDSKIAAPILEDCLRFREDNSLTTIICTNLDFEQIEERYGRSVISLIRGNMTKILIVEADQRKKFFDKKLYDY